MKDRLKELVDEWIKRSAGLRVEYEEHGSTASGAIIYDKCAKELKLAIALDTESKFLHATGLNGEPINELKKATEEQPTAEPCHSIADIKKLRGELEKAIDNAVKTFTDKCDVNIADVSVVFVRVDSFNGESGTVLPGTRVTLSL